MELMMRAAATGTTLEYATHRYNNGGMSEHIIGGKKTVSIDSVLGVSR